VKSRGLLIGEELWIADNRVLLSSAMNESATRLQSAPRYRQSKYVLEHILGPPQLHGGAG
jgi:hypothetical protein